jgi:hypothetical protein
MNEGAGAGGDVAVMKQVEDDLVMFRSRLTFRRRVDRGVGGCKTTLAIWKAQAQV